MGSSESPLLVQGEGKGEVQRSYEAKRLVLSEMRVSRLACQNATLVECEAWHLSLALSLDKEREQNCQ
jgi:hypothetical protein